MALNKQKFEILFTPKVDKSDDFTVEPSQLMRLAKGDVNQIYSKRLEISEDGQSSEQVFRIALSALSPKDIFITIKNRIK